MANSLYSQKLKDPRWQKKRLEIMQRDSFACQKCGDETTTLHVHHHTYTFGKDPWDYNDNNFITLCQDCHGTEELYKDLLTSAIHDALFMGDTYEHIYNSVRPVFERLFSDHDNLQFD